MQCVEFEDRLNAVLDERSRPEWDAELRLHCESCPGCRQLAVAYGALFDGFYALATPEAPSDMATRVMAELQPRPAYARRRALAAAIMATAAALFVAVLPWVDQWRKPTPPVAAVPKPTLLDLMVALRDVPLPLVQFLPVVFSEKDEEAYAKLAQQTGRGLARLVLAVPGGGGEPEMVDVDFDSFGNEPAWAAMSEGFKPVAGPVADGMSEAISLLLKASPVTELASR